MEEEEEEEAWWDGDDMTLEMVTDIGSGDVDEDVRTLILTLHLQANANSNLRWRSPSPTCSHCILAKSSTINAFLNALKPAQQHNYTLCKRK